MNSIRGKAMCKLLVQFPGLHQVQNDSLKRAVLDAVHVCTQPGMDKAVRSLPSLVQVATTLIGIIYSCSNVSIVGIRSNPQSGNESPHWITSGSFY